MKFNEIIIPEKLKKLVLKKKLVRIISFAILFAGVAFVLANWGEIIFKVKEKDIGFRYLFYALTLAIPFAVTKVWLVFTDASYIGVVKKVEIKSVVDSKSSVRLYQDYLYRKNVTYLILETKTSTIKKKVSESTSYEEKFNIGDIVMHLHGTGITIVLPTETDARCKCAVCGRLNEITSDTCEVCAYPLIKG